MGKIIQANHLSKKYQMGAVEVNALADVALTVAKGESVAVMGARGTGQRYGENLRYQRGSFRSLSQHQGDHGFCPWVNRSSGAGCSPQQGVKFGTMGFARGAP